MNINILQKTKFYLFSLPLVFFFGFVPLRIYRIISGKPLEWDVISFLTFLIVFIIIVAISFYFVPKVINTFIVQRFFFTMLFIEDNLYNKNLKNTWKVFPVVFVIGLWLFYSETALYLFFFLVSFFIQLKLQFLPLSLISEGIPKLKTNIVTPDDLLGLMALASRKVFGETITKKDPAIYVYNTVKSRYLSTQQMGEVVLQHATFLRNVFGTLGVGYFATRVIDFFSTKGAQPDSSHQTVTSVQCTKLHAQYKESAAYLREHLPYNPESKSNFFSDVWNKVSGNKKHFLTEPEKEKYVKVASFLKVDITDASICIPDRLHREMENFCSLEQQRAVACLHHAILEQNCYMLINETQKLKRYTESEQFMEFLKERLREKDLGDCMKFCGYFLKRYGRTLYSDILIMAGLSDPVLENIVLTKDAFEKVEFAMSETLGYTIPPSDGEFSEKARHLSFLLNKDSSQKFEYLCKIISVAEEYEFYKFVEKLPEKV